jgi:hypothetical protein
MITNLNNLMKKFKKLGLIQIKIQIMKKEIICLIQYNF